MAKQKLETFVCRRSQNTEMFKCICGRCEAEKLQGRVNGLEKLNQTMLKSLDYTKEENARLQKLVDMNQRVVDAAREALMNCLVERDEPDGIKFIVEEALRELDGEKEMPVGEAIKRQRKKLGW